MMSAAEKKRYFMAQALAQSEQPQPAAPQEPPQQVPDRESTASDHAGAAWLGGSVAAGMYDGGKNLMKVPNPIAKVGGAGLLGLSALTGAASAQHGMDAYRMGASDEVKGYLGDGNLSNPVPEGTQGTLAAGVAGGAAGAILGNNDADWDPRILKNRMKDFDGARGAHDWQNKNAVNSRLPDDFTETQANRLQREGYTQSQEYDNPRKAAQLDRRGEFLHSKTVPHQMPSFSEMPQNRPAPAPNPKTAAMLEALGTPANANFVGGKAPPPPSMMSRIGTMADDTGRAIAQSPIGRMGSAIAHSPVGQAVGRALPPAAAAMTAYDMYNTQQGYEQDLGNLDPAKQQQMLDFAQPESDPMLPYIGQGVTAGEQEQARIIREQQLRDQNHPNNDRSMAY